MSRISESVPGTGDGTGGEVSLVDLATPVPMPVPVLSLGTLSSGGSGPGGTYFWTVSACDWDGGQTPVSNEVTAVLAAGEIQTLNWTGAPNVSTYLVRRGETSGAENYITDTANRTMDDDIAAYPEVPDVNPPSLTNTTLIGLKDAAFRDVGPETGKVAAGDDPRIIAGGTAVQPGDLGDSAGLDVGNTAGTVAGGDDIRLASLSEDPIVPQNLTLGNRMGAAGVFVEGLYYWVVTGTDSQGRESLPSNEISSVESTNDRQYMSWDPMPGKDHYTIYHSQVSGVYTLKVGTSTTETFYDMDWAPAQEVASPPTTSHAFKVFGDAAFLSVGDTVGTVAGGDDPRIVAGGTAVQPGDLGGAALLEVGQETGTVAAGDDPRFSVGGGSSFRGEWTGLSVLTTYDFAAAIPEEFVNVGPYSVVANPGGAGAPPLGRVVQSSTDAASTFTLTVPDGVSACRYYSTSWVESEGLSQNSGFRVDGTVVFEAKSWAWTQKQFACAPSQALQWFGGHYGNGWGQQSEVGLIELLGATAPYVIGDGVTYGGDLYVCASAGTGSTPGVDGAWTKVLDVPQPVEVVAVVNHGAVASTARPAGSLSVYWIGSVEPTNAIDGEFWMDTA